MSLIKYYIQTKINPLRNEIQLLYIVINHCFKHSIQKLIITHNKSQKILFISSSNFNFENTDFFILNKN